MHVQASSGSLLLLALVPAVVVATCVDPVGRSVGDDSCCAAVDSLLEAATANQLVPAAAAAWGTSERIVGSGGYGSFTYTDPTPVTDTTRFDLASLTKVVVTTTAVMLLAEGGHVHPDSTVASYVPEFGANGKDGVTIRHLLQHRGGLAPFRRFYLQPDAEAADVVEAILGDTLVYLPGTDQQYSDLGFIVLGLVVERVSGSDLATFADLNIFRPLRMTRTGFRETDGSDSWVVPTEIDTVYRDRLVQGEVHDENAFLLGGTAGHAGLFSTASDLARFARMLLGNGTLDDRRFLDSTTVAAFTNRVHFAVEERGLGWDFKSLEGYSSAGSRFGSASFGHTGFTGTSIWLDPAADVFAILLTNRVYPSRENRAHLELRPRFADLAHEAVVG